MDQNKLQSLKYVRTTKLQKQNSSYIQSLLRTRVHLHLLFACDVARKTTKHLNAVSRMQIATTAIKEGILKQLVYRKKANSKVIYISQQAAPTAHTISEASPPTLPLQVNGQSFIFEIDTGSRDNFCSKEVWVQLGQPELQPATSNYFSATKRLLLILGTRTITADLENATREKETVKLNVVDIPQLNLLGRHTIKQLDIDVNQLLKGNYISVYTISPHTDKEMRKLQEDCSKLCTAFPGLVQARTRMSKRWGIRNSLQAGFTTDIL